MTVVGRLRCLATVGTLYAAPSGAASLFAVGSGAPPRAGTSESLSGGSSDQQLLGRGDDVVDSEAKVLEQVFRLA